MRGKKSRGKILIFWVSASQRLRNGPLLVAGNFIKTSAWEEVVEWVRKCREEKMFSHEKDQRYSVAAGKKCQS